MVSISPDKFRRGHRSNGKIRDGVCIACSIGKSDIGFENKSNIFFNIIRIPLTELNRFE